MFFIVMIFNKFENVGVGNVWVIMVDVIVGLEYFFGFVDFDELWIFFVDLWYKKCYYKCCIVNFDIVCLVMFWLCLGGLWCLVIDWDDYVYWMFEVFLVELLFKLVDVGLDGFSLCWFEWLVICYENKGLMVGCIIYDFIWCCVDGL